MCETTKGDPSSATKHTMVQRIADVYLLFIPSNNIISATVRVFGVLGEGKRVQAFLEEEFGGFFTMSHEILMRPNSLCDSEKSS